MDGERVCGKYWVCLKLGNRKREWTEHGARNQGLWILVILLAEQTFSVFSNVR